MIIDQNSQNSPARALLKLQDVRPERHAARQGKKPGCCWWCSGVKLTHTTGDPDTPLIVLAALWKRWSVNHEPIEVLAHDQDAMSPEQCQRLLTKLTTGRPASR